MKALEDIEKLLKDQAASPPVEKWHPDLSGDIDIVIAADGRWFHEGGEIKRHELVKLFASILRKEDDEQYYLVTPVEKWRITVEDCPLQIIDLEVSDQNPPTIAVKTNTGAWYPLSEDHPLTVEFEDNEPRPGVMTTRGLLARVNRSCFYRLVDLALEEDGKLILPCKDGPFILGTI
ncbi:Protein of unknown function (DUF1285) [Spongiibacter sp. IMCC21906]|uniref:DUF1285 domain-containing protein n=1 Tax=Spongiibacter sp. IMCC21906 TaxID=1620392 RepID=UPI00062DF980|nr:DUF1285 domain-containing protein [Spongiibacter sp. IMCC21906]AKH69803.1 Protein of unknown function (DUF1285) [Spongiibacter sp. IMCC21906]